MFTGIIEALGIVKSLTVNGANLSFWIESPISAELKPDQSLSHNGVCLTVEEVSGTTHRVTAIAETLQKTNLSKWEEGAIINLERCVSAGGRFDGHFVQGHADSTATCTQREDRDGSWEYRFRFDTRFASLLVEKGSVSINGISLTVFDVTTDQFSVAIIPYTFEHTNMQHLQAGHLVNIEFDMVGKYIQRHLQLKQPA